MDEKREELIQAIANMLRHNAFKLEFEVKKNPKGIRVIYEGTQEEIDAIMKGARNG